jgi:cell division protein FtsB
MSPAAALGSAARMILPSRQRPARPALRVVARRPARQRRAPFVVLVLLLLGVGLVGLLVLNTALQQGSFDLADLEQRTALLRDRRAELVGQVADKSAPGTLARQARELDMIPAENLLFLPLDGIGTR